MIEFVLGQGRPTTTYEPASHRITATKIERREATYDPNHINEYKIEQGRKAWNYLHTSDDEPEIVLQKFEAMIPSYGCGCKNEYMAMKREFPPDMSDKDSFWRWGWFLHNLVNEKLGKPLIELEEARRIWNRPEPTE